jgi:GntR family transcriptional regulator
MWKPDPSDPRPIWHQIERHVHLQVGSGELGAGMPVPSVRQSARDMGVNPATIAKAYQRLVDAGVLEVRRGEGTFVSPLSERQAERLRGDFLSEAAEIFARKATTLGCDEAAAGDALHRAFEILQDANRETNDE